MDIVKGIADLIRRSSGSQTSDNGSGAHCDKFAASVASSLNGDAGKEAVLNTLWNQSIRYISPKMIFQVGLVDLCSSHSPRAHFAASRDLLPAAMVELAFTTFLQLAWTAATAPILVASLPIRPTRFLHQMLMGFAARGKIMKSSSSRFTVPQRYFLHFYLLALALTTFLALATWFYAYRNMLPLGYESSNFSTIDSHLCGGSPLTSMEHKLHVWRTSFVLLLMEVQVLRRLYETLHVFHYSPSARMHFLGYLSGMFFYTVAPLSLGISCASVSLSYLRGQISDSIAKGLEQVPGSQIEWLQLLKPFAYLGWRQWTGFIIFFWGWLHQLHCHAILGSLRENKGADKYVIPHGDWFTYVSCPHYLAEIVIYLGILVATGGSDTTVWLLFTFVVSNLVFAAAETHRWYHQKFDNYPKSRRAIIPFIY